MTDEQIIRVDAETLALLKEICEPTETHSDTIKRLAKFWKAVMAVQR